MFTVTPWYMQTRGGSTLKFQKMLPLFAKGPTV
jgi:hypothetical protein